MLNVMKIDKNIDSLTILFLKYYNFRNIFDRKKFEELSLYKNYNYSIFLLLKKTSFFNSLYEMIHVKNEKFKLYFKKNLKKKFIEIN